MWNEFKRQVFGCKPKKKSTRTKQREAEIKWQKEYRRIIKEHHKIK